MILDVLTALAFVVVCAATLLAAVLWWRVGWPTLPPDHEPEPGTLLHDLEQVRSIAADAGAGVVAALGRGVLRLLRWVRGGAW